MGLVVALTLLVAGCSDDDAMAPGDGGAADAAERDGSRDSGDPDAGPTEPRPPYTMLSETGLYEDVGRGVVVDEALPFSPNDELWSDGADKRRWIVLPEGSVIDTSNSDRWRFPVGTRVFKEFSRDGVVLETRLIQRVGDSGAPLSDFWMGAFVWNAAGTDAAFVPDGADDVGGTSHDVPSVEQCHTCHGGEPGQVLGLSAIQASGARSTPTLDELVTMGLLSDPPPAGTSWPVPGDDVVRPALGYLHANCGHCHNRAGAAWFDTNLALRLWTDERTPEETRIYATTVDVPLGRVRDPAFTMRVVSGDPDMSEVVRRMTIRGALQMPPIGTEQPDADGIAAVRAWISSL